MARKKTWWSTKMVYFGGKKGIGYRWGGKWKQATASLSDAGLKLFRPSRSKVKRRK